jgi:glycosyl transferase family 25
LTRTEIACALSHIQIAKKIIEQNLDYAIILEDDAELTLDFKMFLKDFALEKNMFDFLILGSFSSNQFFNDKVKTSVSPYVLVEKESITYLDKIELNIGNVFAHRSYYPSQQLDYVHGTHAYMISYAGAKKLIELNFPVVVEADNIWNYYSDKCNILFTNPILVHRQHEDSDIRHERNTLTNNADNFSEIFNSRANHIDFGT